MGKFKFLFMSVLVALFSMTMVSCSSDDDEGKTTDAATVVAGDYSGTLKPLGYSDDPAKCYVKLTRLSKDAVRVNELSCEEFNLDLKALNLTVTDNGNGTYSLNTETGRKSITGTYNNGQLILSVTVEYYNANGYVVDEITFYFSGMKN